MATHHEHDHHDEPAAPAAPTPKKPRAKKVTPATTPDAATAAPTAPASKASAKKATSKKAIAARATAPSTAPKKSRARKAAASVETSPVDVPTEVSTAPVDDPMTQIDEILRAEMRRAQVIEPQMRMLMRALTDCGLGVTPDHVRVDEPTGDVAIALSWKAVKALTSALQDLAAHRPVVVVAPPAGPTLFDTLPPAGPVAPQPAGSGLHIEVPA